MTTKNETRTPQVERPKFLVSIVERGKGKAIINLYNKEGVNYHYQTIGHGTATSEIMDILGLDSKDKDIVISVSTRSMIEMCIRDSSYAVACFATAFLTSCRPFLRRRLA